MKTAKTTKKLFVTAIALVTAAAIWATLGARRAQAQGSETFLPYIEQVGIASGQTARLSALNSNAEREFVIDWRFLDSQGRILAQSREPQLIPPGQMRSFDLNADEVNTTMDRFGRVQVIAIIRTLGGPDTKNLHTSLEVFDNATGKTTVFVSPTLVPQPDPSGGQYIWGRVENLRFGDLNPQPQPPGVQK